jgi:hypothetical protein
VNRDLFRIEEEILNEVEGSAAATKRNSGDLEHFTLTKSPSQAN